MTKGKLLAVSLDNGQIVRQAAFPQQLAATVALSPTGDALVQCGDHSNLYVLDAASLECRAVHYLGHDSGTIDNTPAFVGSQLVVAQHVGLNRSQLHTLAYNRENASLVATSAPLAIGSWLSGRLLVEGPRVVVIDRSGGIRVLAIEEDNDAARLAIVAEKRGQLRDAAPHAIVDRGWLLVGDERLAGYRIPAASGTLPAAWVNHEGDRFVAPLQVAGEYFFAAHRHADSPGVVISAAATAPADGKNAGQPIWQTQLAVAAKGAVHEGGEGEIEALCASGDRYTLPATVQRRSAINVPSAKEQELQQPAIEPQAVVSWRDGFLSPNAQGQIAWHSHQDDAANKTSLFPFQPVQRPGDAFQWLSPAIIDRERFVAADRTGRTYVVSVSTQGAPHLAAALEARLDGPLVAGPVCCGQHAFFVQRRDDADAIVAVRLSDLQPEKPLALPGRVRWGPVNAGDVAMLAVEPGGLVAVEGPAVKRWTGDLQMELPVGEPLVDGESMYVATSSGRVLQFSLTAGEVQRAIDFGQPLGSGPAIIEQKLYVRAADGAILRAEASP
jgi:hypothetical protein